MEDFRLLLPLIVLELILKVVAFLDLNKRTNQEVKGGKRWPWALGVLLLTTIGPVVYLVWGRNEASA